MRFASEQSNMNIKASTSQNAGRGAQAFTLIEVLVSVALLAIMMAAIYPAFVIGFASVKTTREDERATQILTQKLEAVRLLTYAQLTNNLNNLTFTEYYNPAGLSNNTQGATYVGTVSISAATILTTETYKSLMSIVTMTVTWTNSVAKASIPHSRTMQTLSAYNGLQNYVW